MTGLRQATRRCLLVTVAGAATSLVVLASLLAPVSAEPEPPPPELPSTWVDISRGERSRATDLNDRGQIVGYMYTYGDLYHGFFGELSSRVFVLDTTSGDRRGLGSSAPLHRANAVNEAGYIVGARGWPLPPPMFGQAWTSASWAAGGSLETSASSSSRGVPTGPPYFGPFEGINDENVAVGGVMLDSNEYAIFLLDMDDSHFATIPVEWSNERALDIANDGSVVGERRVGDDMHAFRYDPVSKEFQDLGTLPGDATSVAVAVNDSGTLIVGRSGWTGFVYDVATETMTSLGPGTTANDVNDAGLVVGASNGHAFIYDTASQTMTDVHDARMGSWSTLEAIDNSGQLAVGTADVGEAGGAVALTTWAFPDAPRWHAFFDDIEWLADQDVTEGFEDGTFRPVDTVTRQSMAAFLYRYAGSPPFTPPETPTFSDVPSDHPFFAEIEWLAAEAISVGFGDGTYRPGATITRQSMAALLYRLSGEPAFTPPGSPSFTDVPVSHAFSTEIEWLASTEVTTGFEDGTFRPTNPVTRQAFAAFLHRYDELPG